MLDRYQFSVEALAETELCQFPRQQFLATVDRFGSLKDQLLHMAYDELETMHEHLFLLGKLHATERLAAFLLYHYEREQRRGNRIDPMRLALRRHEIAEYLGLALETVSRSFTQLGLDGLISLQSPNDVRFTNLRRLKALAAFD